MGEARETGPAARLAGLWRLVVDAPFRSSLLFQMGVLCLYGYVAHGAFVLHYLPQRGASWDARHLVTAAEKHRDEHGVLPDSLAVLRTGSDTLPAHCLLDPWGRPYIYEQLDGRPVVRSFGSDGVAGGRLEARDVVVGRRVSMFQDWPTPWEFVISRMPLYFAILTVLPCSFFSLFVMGGLAIHRDGGSRLTAAAFVVLGLVGGLKSGAFLLFVGTLGWS